MTYKQHLFKTKPLVQVHILPTFRFIYMYPMIGRMQLANVLLVWGHFFTFKVKIIISDLKHLYYTTS